MPKPKRPANRGKSRGLGSSGSRAGHVPAWDADYVPFGGTSSPKNKHNSAFSLQDEARYTERHHSWNTDQRLRDTKVNFVSAGNLTPSELQEAKDTQPKDTESALADMSLNPSTSEAIEADVEVDLDMDIEEGKAEFEDTLKTSRPAQHEHNADASVFVIDTQGSIPVNTGLAPPRLRSPSPTPSNSSEEVILFAGRNQSRRGVTRKLEPLTRNPDLFPRRPDPPRTPVDSIDLKIKIVEDKIHAQEELLQEALQSKCTVPQTSNVPGDSGGLSSTEFEAILPKRNGRGRRRCRRGHQNLHDTEDEALIADYIANIDRDELQPNAAFNQRELGGAESDEWQDETELSSGELAEPSSKKPFENGWERSELEDLDDLSTSDEVLGSVLAILSKRHRESGLQYLVVWENQTVDEARWVPASTLIQADAVSEINAFEAEEKLVAEFMDDGDDDSSDESDDEDLEDYEDEDNADLLQRKIDRMTDEQIARLLAKQEQLGMGSNELLLFDDDVDGNEDDSFRYSNPRLSHANSFIPIQKRTKRKGAKRPRGDFPAATALADAYDGFDVMDFERPSLKKKPKGRKGKLILDDISDSELEASMQIAWYNDRIKKKERKQEREELRSQGLLGRKNGKPDLKEKYKEGMGIHAVKEEIKRFLQGANTTLALPPMDKADRKIVHELANAFKLKSKSQGNGNNRFPILIRTSKTSAYVERTFAEVEARLTRRFLPRIDVSGKRSGAAGKRVGRGGGFNSAAVSYRDGDIVGGSAPELGAENKGRAMLEKMGWSSGTALGALNNKGILQPVAHVVKNSKAGLG